MLGGEPSDPTGDLVVRMLREHGHRVSLRTIVPDERHIIEHQVRQALKSDDVDVVITCGGTGISPTDVTIEAVQPLLEKELHGFGEIFRRLSYDSIGSAAILTRAIAGVSMGKAVFCVPGSPQAARLCLEKLILPEAGHIIKHAREKG